MLKAGTMIFVLKMRETMVIPFGVQFLNQKENYNVLNYQKLHFISAYRLYIYVCNYYYILPLFAAPEVGWVTADTDWECEILPRNRSSCQNHLHPWGIIAMVSDRIYFVCVTWVSRDFGPIVRHLYSVCVMLLSNTTTLHFLAPPKKQKVQHETRSCISLFIYPRDQQFQSIPSSFRTSSRPVPRYCFWKYIGAKSLTFLRCSNTVKTRAQINDSMTLFSNKKFCSTQERNYFVCSHEEMSMSRIGGVFKTYTWLLTFHRMEICRASTEEV